MLAKLFAFLTQIKLICPNQSCFKLSDALIDQILFIINEISKSFDDSLEVWVIFLYISKHLIRYGIRISSENKNNMTFQEICRYHYWFFKLQRRNSCFKWTVFFMEQYWSRCTSRINTWTISIFNLHYWPLWSFHNKC